MRYRLVGIAALLLSSLIACNASAVTPTATPAIVERVPDTPVPTPAATSTPLLVITFITPTPLPTDAPTAPPVATTATEATPVSSGDVATKTTPPELGNSGADSGLVRILQSCWAVNDPRQLNGANAAQREAFQCAREPLANLAASYPAYALVHRVIAWGYFYKDSNIDKAAQEYRTAAGLYHQAADAVGESEARMRLGLLLAASSRSQACNEFSLAGNLDPSNDRAIKYYSAYNCGSAPPVRSGNSGNAAPPPPPVLQVNLEQLRGKILFKSDREGDEGFYVMDADGSNQKRVTSGAYTAASRWESWSPDHTSVATVRNAGFSRQYGYNNDIWITDPTGGSGRPLPNNANDYDPVWSPGSLFDGRNWIAFVSNRGDVKHNDKQGEEIFLMHPDGTGDTRLTCFGLQSKHPSWSANTSNLVFHSTFPNGNKMQIFIVDMSKFGSVGDACQIGDTAKNLSNNDFNDSEPVWVK